MFPMCCRTREWREFAVVFCDSTQIAVREGSNVVAVYFRPTNVDAETVKERPLAEIVRLFTFALWFLL